MPKLSELTKQLKEFALNPAISDEEFLNAFLFPFVIAGNITNKNHEEFHLDKSRTSEIMNQKADVPVKLRKALSIFGIEEKTIEGMVSFLEDYIDLNRQMVLLEAFTTLAKIEGVFPDNNSDSNDAQEELAIILTALLLKAVSESNLAKADIVLIWKHGLNSIDVQTGDLFHFGFDNRHKKKNIVVIPVNTAFDTHVTRRFEGETFPLVSENTVHGQWLVRLEETGEKLDRIDERIADSLKRAGFCPIKESKAGNGKKDCYPVGSVSIIETSNAVYFLMAMAEFDDFNNARSSSNDIDSAITSLLNMYDRFGLGYDLYLPLMGTGLSRAGLSMQEAYDLLIGSLRKNTPRMDISLKIKQLVEKRKMINGDVDYENDPTIKEMIRLMTEDMDSTVAFLRNECSEDQLIWISEIADEITAHTKSSEFIDALRDLCKKYPEVSEKYNVPYFVESAAEYLE